MRTLQAQIGAAPRTVGALAGHAVGLAPALELAGFSMRFRRNDEIFGEEEPAEYVYQVTAGAARSVRILSDGRRQVMGFHFAGEIFGVESAALHHCSAEAIVDCEVVLIKRAALDARARSEPAAAGLLWTLAARDLTRLRDHVLLLGRKTAAERVGDFLAEMADRAPAGRGFVLPMPRSDIADYLGLTIETVSRMLSKLQQRRAIAIEGVRHIVLRDLPALGAA